MPKELKIFLIVVACGVVFVGGLVWFLVFATSGMVEPIERQLAALKAGDINAAYAETSEAFQQATPLPAFTTFVDQYPILKEAASYSFPNRSMNNDAGEVQGSLTSSTGGVTPVNYRLVYEKDAWKIIYINVEAAGGS